MRSRVKVNLGNVLLSLSDAMELVSPEISQHQQRTAFTVWQMGKAAGLPERTIEEVFVAALLHDVGALSVEEKESLHQSSPSYSEEKEVARHCILGQALLEKVPWLKPAAEIVRYHHTYLKEWDGSTDAPGVLRSQMLLLADRLERRIQRDKPDPFEEIDSRVKEVQSAAMDFYNQQFISHD